MHNCAINSGSVPHSMFRSRAILIHHTVTQRIHAKMAAVTQVRSCIKGTVAVRVEDETSVGRSYSKKGELIAGLGARRRELRETTWRDAYGIGTSAKPTLESYTMAKINLSKCTREDVLEYFRNTWDITTALFSGLRDDSVFYCFPDKLRRPLVFYSAHTAAVYANKMHQAGMIDQINPYLQKMFETGVDEMSWDDMDVMQDEDFAWPTIEEVVKFRAQVKEVVEDVIKQMPNPRDDNITMDSPYWALFMGFEHERIHIETSSVLIHQLPIDSVIAPPGWRTAPTFAKTAAEAPKNELVTVNFGATTTESASTDGITAGTAAIAVLGKPKSFPSFGWDNEYGERVVEVPPFSASKFTVSNGEFLPFVLSGGYVEKKWWVSEAGDDEGLRWRQFRNATHPSFWVATSHPDMVKYHGGRPNYPYQKDDGHPRAGSEACFKLRTIFDIIDMPWDWPVEVNYLEATAFMRWKAAMEGGKVTYRMPTEAEFHIMRGDPVPFSNATSGLFNKSGFAGGAETAPLLPVENDGRVVAPDGVVIESSAEEIKYRNADTIDDCGKYDVIMQPTAPGNINMRWHSSTPVNMYPPSSTGFYDSHGNVYQWVEDHFSPLPGFEIHYLYDDFSTPCFDGWHTEIMGGSWVSTGDQASSFARYHFRRHFFQHLGFRYVAIDAAKPEAFPGCATVANLWEGMSTVSNDITNAFAKVSDKVPFSLDLLQPQTALAYPANIVALVLSASKCKPATEEDSKAMPVDISGMSVLHLGCGVGGVTMELTKAGFGKVVGVDSREPVIRHARVMQHHGQYEYERVDEGVLTSTSLVKLSVGTERVRAVFFNEDPVALPAEVLAHGPFDIVLVDDIMCSMVQPLDLVRKLPQYIRPGGICLIASGNDWDARITPRNSWLGGFKMNGENMSTLHMLQYHLKKSFEFVQAVDVPKMTRSHNRKFSLNILETSVWRRLH